jgi:hypothetical protein
MSRQTSEIIQGLPRFGDNLYVVNIGVDWADGIGAWEGWRMARPDHGRSPNTRPKSGYVPHR